MRFKHTITFEWQVCEMGYQLNQNSIIEPLGNKFRSYFPHEINPSVHYLLAHVGEMLLKPGETEPEPVIKRRDQKIEFWQRRFDSETTALMAFVNEYGLLFGSGEHAREPLWRLSKAAAELSMFKSFSDNKLRDFNGMVRLATDSFTLQLQKNPDGSYQREAVPTTLLGWMWDRLSRDFEDEVEWTNCRYCHRPMAIGGGTRNSRYYRRDAEVCSDVCRSLLKRKLVSAYLKEAIKVVKQDPNLSAKVVESFKSAKGSWHGSDPKKSKPKKRKAKK